jgi:hypothetical protein
MATVIRTPKAKYTVEGVRVNQGTVQLIARSAPGAKVQYIDRKRAGRTRFDSAVAHWFASQVTS